VSSGLDPSVYGGGGSPSSMSFESAGSLVSREAAPVALAASADELWCSSDVATGANAGGASISSSILVCLSPIGCKGKKSEEKCGGEDGPDTLTASEGDKVEGGYLVRDRHENAHSKMWCARKCKLRYPSGEKRVG